jgi:hypothetical protein
MVGLTAYCNCDKRNVYSGQILLKGHDEDDLKKCLKNQNPSLKNINGMFKLIACKKMKTRFLTIVEVDPQTFSELIKLERVYIGWDVCRVYEHVNVIRCFNWGGLNHISKNCPTEEPTCLNCGEKDVKGKGSCKKEVICVNGTRRNREESLNLSVNHSCLSYSRETYTAVGKFVNTFFFNISCKKIVTRKFLIFLLNRQIE